MNFNPLKSIRTNKSAKFVAAFLVINIITQLGFPTVSFALTSGPGQEEFSSFEPASTSDMVDLYTGDYNYNIPLFTIPGPDGGYPINLSYHSGASMDEEASWVGLGWSLNVGSINREIRGLPDDYIQASANNNVVHTQHFKTSYTASLNASESGKAVVFGLQLADLGIGASIYYNNFKGLGYRVFASAGTASKDYLDAGGSSFKLELSFDSQNGLGIEPDYSVKGSYKAASTSLGLNASLNTREGLQSIGFTSSFNARKDLNAGKKDDQGNALAADYKFAGGEHSSSLSFAFNQVAPQVEMPMRNHEYDLDISPSMISTWPAAFNIPNAGATPEFGGSLTISEVDHGSSPNSLLYEDGVGYIYTPQSGNGSVQQDFSRDPITYSDKIPNLPASNFTYDLYMQTGQGTGSIFRPYLSSSGALTDPQIASKNNDMSLLVEVGSTDGVSNHVKVGANYGWGDNISGPWQSVSNDDINSNLNGLLGFSPPEVSYPNGSGGFYNSYLDPSYENYYFQVYGEKSAILLDDDYLTNNWAGDQAVRVQLSPANTPSFLNRHFTADNNFITSSAASSPNTNNNGNVLQYKLNGKRQVRGTNIEHFTNNQASAFGYTRLNSSASGGANYTVDDVLVPGGSVASPKNFHLTDAPSAISEMSVLQEDGMRYVYGLPQYNTYQLEATFSVNGPDNNDITKTPVPSSGGKIDPSAGSDTYQEYLNQTELTQPYASSWLLTSVLSDDYVDRTGDGPTPDDYGYWVKFNYKKTSNGYNWRIPYSEAQYIEGAKNYNRDDKGTLTFGTKELYYIESIQTKTHIAVFTTSVRQDGVGALDMLNGGIGNVPSNLMYKLDRVDLYTMANYNQHIANSSVPLVPVKTINFRYSYSLCPGIPNNRGAAVNEYGGTPTTTNPNVNFGGKLTLDTLFFTYQNSSRGESSPYVFNYADKGVSGTNPAYNDTYIDRWGDFKDNGIYSNSGVAGSTNYPYYDFPYTDPYNYIKADGTVGTNPLNGPSYNTNHFGNYSASLWNLTGINLPTGGTINISYERKDYANVENNQAETMFDMVDMGTNSSNPNAPANLGSSRFPNLDQRDASTLAINSATNGSRIWFKLEQPVIGSDVGPSSPYILQHYLEGGTLTSVYYQVYCDLLGGGALYASGQTANGNSTADYVKGYAALDNSVSTNYGTDATGTYGYVTLLQVPLSAVNYTGKNINPITRSCIEFLRAQRPELLYNFTQNNSLSFLNQFLNFVGSVITILPQVASSLTGFNEYAYSLGFAQNVYMNGRSVIRLGDPSGKKYGGGVRVNQLTLSDNWVNNSTSNSFMYGQTYTYTIDGTPTGVSSGVAYEPGVGFEESALCNAIDYTNSTLFGANDHLFMETPIMKSYYPGASVGYSKVTVTSIGKTLASTDNSNNILSHSAAPMSVYEFYTPKDFPVQFNQTDLSSDPPITIPVMIPGIYSSFIKRKARSQGYSVILNDMSGKMKRVTVLTQPSTSNPTGNLISEKDYNYQTVQPYNANGGNQLSDVVQVLTSDHGYQSALLGESSDVFLDMNENRQESNGLGFAFDGDLGLPLEIFFAIIPNISYSDLSVRTVVTNKIIYRTGILQNIVTTTDQSKVTETNLAYDPNTGQPLLTSTTNEFNAPIYNYSYPAYWYYPNMGGAYQNSGMTVNSNGNISHGSSNTLQVQTIVNGGDIDITGFFPTTQASNYYTDGDEVWLTYSSGGITGEYTVAAVNGSHITCIDPTGNYAINGNLTSMQTIRSGYKNLQSLMAGTLVSKDLQQFVPFNLNNPVSATNYNEPYPYYNAPYSLDSIIDAKAIEYRDKWAILCDANDDYYSGGGGEEGIPRTDQNCTKAGSLVNPYWTAEYGIWRPFRSWAYVTGRTQNNDIRTDGVYDDFRPFPWGNDQNVSYSNWVASNTVTKYSPYGFEVEDVNSIGVYSSATYGYDNSLITAIGSNAQYHEIGFDGFEDYPGSCDNNHFRFGFTSTSGVAGQLVQNIAHTGNYSMQVYPQTYVQMSKALYPTADSTCPAEGYTGNGSSTSFPLIGSTPYGTGTGPSGPIVPGLGTIPDNIHLTQDIYSLMRFSACDCIGEFWPSPGKTYVISGWVKENPQSNTLPVNVLPNYTSPRIEVDFFQLNYGNILFEDATFDFNTSGNIIDGWQKIYGTFIAPSTATSMIIYLQNNSSTSNPSNVYFDDIRVQPFEGGLNAFVYDKNSLRIMAELDDNNFATFYNYDDEGHITKTKKETVNGISTIQEGRSNNIAR